MSRAPEVRFKGFTDAWEQRELSKAVENVGTGRSTFVSNVEKSRETPYAVLGSTSVISYDSNFDHEGDFILTARVGANAGNMYRHSGRVKISDNTVYIQSGNLDFILYLLEKFDLKSLSFGTGQPLIKSSELKGLVLNYPNKLEQAAIGNFFRTLDNTIAIHKRKLDGLRQLKKAYLQVMFPQAEEIVPRLRFKGFTEPWGLRKLEHYFAERSERSGEGELISVTINSGVVKASDLDRQIISSEDKSNYKAVKAGDIAYNSMRMWQGASGYSSYDGILSPAYTVITPKENVHSPFFANLFKKLDMIQTFQRNSQGLTSDTWNLKFPTFSQIEVYAPMIDEQRAIADFFELFDGNIEFQSQRITQLQQLKTAYLQKMFV